MKNGCEVKKADALLHFSAVEKRKEASSANSSSSNSSQGVMLLEKKERSKLTTIVWCLVDVKQGENGHSPLPTFSPGDGGGVKSGGK